jgi:Flp pilus assembly pilin Flp
MKKTLTLLTLIPTICLGQWMQIGSAINGEAAGDASGRSISINSNGTVIAIGANYNQGSGPSATSAGGHVRVYENVNGNWVQIGSDIDGDGGDQTGQYVSVSQDGSTVAVGEPISAVNGSLSGQVRVFRNVNNNWTQIGGSINGDSFNWQTGSVSLSTDGSILAVGSRGAAVPGLGPFSGKARIYAYQSGDWVQIGNDINASGQEDFFGVSISLSSDGSIVAIGAIGDIFNNDTGYISVFENVAGTWTQIGSNINGSTPAGEFGNSVSLSADGSTVATGEYLSVPGGSAKVFKNVNGIWTQIGNTILGNAGDFLGHSVSLSANGNILGVGVYGRDDNGVDAGSTIVFENQSDNWIQIGNVINGGSAGNFSGIAVSLSSDGSIVATSAPGDDANGNNAGHVRVFENSEVLNIKDISSKNNFYVYPNPATKSLTIKCDSEIIAFELFSLLGQLIYIGKANGNKEIEIKLDGLPSGNYLVKVKTTNKPYYTKIIKE